MTEDWAIDVQKYAPGADPDIIAGLVRYCGIALRITDSSLVSLSDKTETDRVKANFLRKKLGLADADAALDAAIARVGDQMSGAARKNRVTVYYLLADAFGRLEDFRPKAKAKMAKPVAEPEVVAAVAAKAAPVAPAQPVMAPPPPPPCPPPVPSPEPLIAAARSVPLAANPAGAPKPPGLFWLLTAALVVFGGIAAMIVAGSR